MENDTLATGIMSFVMHEVVYFGRSLPWVIIDMIPWFRKFKIQNVQPPLFPDHSSGSGLIHNRPSFQPQKSNGDAQSWFSCLTSLLSFPRSGLWPQSCDLLFFDL